MRGLIIFVITVLTTVAVATTGIPPPNQVEQLPSGLWKWGVEPKPGKTYVPGPTDYPPKQAANWDLLHAMTFQSGTFAQRAALPAADVAGRKPYMVRDCATTTPLATACQGGGGPNPGNSCLTRRNDTNTAWEVLLCMGAAVDQSAAYTWTGLHKFNGQELGPVPAAESIAAGGTITANACGGLKRVTTASAIATSTTNTFTAPGAGNAGCRMDVCNSGASNITLDSNANFVPIAAEVDVLLRPGACTPVVSDGTKWFQAASVLDDFFQVTNLTSIQTQLRIPAQTLSGAVGGIDIDATGLAAGSGLVVENSMNSPIVAGDVTGWIQIDGNGSAPPAPFTGQPAFVIEAHAAGTNEANQADALIVLRRSRGTHQSPTTVALGNILGTIIWQGYDGQGDPWGNGGQGGVAAIEVYANENFDATHHATSMALYTTNSAGTLLQTLRLTKDGTGNFPVGLKVGALTDPQVALDVTGNFALTGGVSNSTGLQHMNQATTCTTAATAGATCTSGALTWPVTFGNTSYRAVCSIATVGGGVPVLGAVTKSSASITVQVIAITASAASASVDCVGIHI